MLEVSGFSSLQVLRKEDRTILYRGIRDLDNKRVILKKIITEPPDLNDLKRLQEEFILLTKLPLKDVLKPLEFLDNGKQAAYVLEDEGETVLAQYLSEKTFTIQKFLEIAISLTDVISDLHFRGMIHKDIKPANILINQENNTAKIINFDSISFPWHSHASNFLRGTLAYISPEQTGRMNKPIDYRTDFYSLGITFYEMLTGQIPFKSTDAIGMVHAHIANMPEPPESINPNVPLALSNIIMKLLAKIPDERYQSTFGLKADLEYCLAELLNNGRITNFTLAKKDVSEHFIISQKLYGREKEKELLLESFDEAKKGRSCLLWVTGYAGIGKSTLINEIHKPVIVSRGYYCASKFEQFQRDIPYSAFINIIKSLVKQLLTENEAKLTKWQELLKDKLGDNIALISNIVPELELIVGKQSNEIQFESDNAEIMFYKAVKDFFQLFANENHPLVIFVDDMQWCSFSSLKLLEYLVHSDLLHIMIIGAYRDNEINFQHPLAHILQNLEKPQQKINFNMHKIMLRPLTLDYVEELVADTLFKDINNIKELALICFTKTQGNPFFLNQLLKLMFEEGLILFDNKHGVWKWAIEKIKRLPVTSNVVDLMLRKLEKFPENTKNLLKLAACIGNAFSLKLLMLISNLSISDVVTELRPAINEGYLLPYDGEVQMTNENISAFTYKFLHDKVHQAAYQLIDENERKITHKRIGEALISTADKEEIEKNIFYIVNHFNAAIDLIKTSEEKIELAKLNLLAGKKAKESVAFNQSLTYLKLGLQLLDAKSWKLHYRLALTLHTEAAYLAYLLNNHKMVEKLSKLVLVNARTNLDQMRIYEIKVNVYTKLDKCVKAILIAKEALAKYNIDIPTKNILFNLIKETLKLKFISLFKTQKAILNAPVLTDENMQAAIRIMAKVLPAAQSKSVELLGLIAIKIVLLSIKHGNSVMAINAYTLAPLVFWKAGDRKNTQKFRELAFQLIDKFNAKREKSLALLTINTFINPWLNSLRSSLPGLMESYKIANDLGEVDHIGYCSFFYSIYSFWASVELSTTLEETNKMLEAVKPYKQNIPILSLKLLLQLLENLHKEINDPIVLSGSYITEADWLEQQAKTNNVLQITAFNFLKMYLSCLFGKFTEACLYADKIDSNNFIGMYSYAMILFFDSLSRLGNYANVSTAEKIIYLKRVRKNQKLLYKLAQSAPMNFLDKYYLVNAEYNRIRGKYKNAAKLYDRAIQLSQEHQLTQEEAIGNELAGKFYLQVNKKFALSYLRDAYYAYKKWGAHAKLLDLEKSYPALMAEVTQEIVNPAAFPQALDLSSILKASQVISKEIALRRLVKKSLKIVVENVGADRCVLLLMRNNELYIEGEYNNNQAKFLHLLESIPYTQNKSLPEMIIDYVKRTKEMVKIDDITLDRLFTQDSYLNLHKPKSILCYPLIQHSELQGIFYFENTLAVNAFTTSRLQLLDSLSAQIAISIENARLYEAFKRFVPQEFLNMLGKQNVVDVQLGDYLQKSISVLFMDIGGFTALSEQLSPNEIFKFINKYLSYMEPVIAKHQGFIDKYIGDGIMALFPESADDALNAAIALQETISNYNRLELTNAEFKIGARIGINTGPSILGTIGSKHRIDGSVVGDAVNTASRITDLNQLYGATILISEHTRLMLKHPEHYTLRMIDKVKVKGKMEILAIWEVLINNKKEDEQILINEFTRAWNLYAAGEFLEAKVLFQKCYKHHPHDKVSKYFMKRCAQLAKNPPDNWDGITIVTSKIHF